MDPTIGSVHRSVVGSFMPVKIMLPLYSTTYLSLSNLTAHPAAVRTRIPNREAIDNSRTIWPKSGVGRPGIIISHICVDITLRPSAKAIFSGHVVCRRLWTGILSMFNIWVAPESAIASFNAIFIAAYPHFGSLCGVIEENMLSCVLPCLCLCIRLASVLADSRLVVNPSETFDVMTVMLSSSTIISQAGEYILVGSSTMLITENVSFHLNATSLLIAPNRHICRNTVLWRFFVAHLYPAHSGG